MRSSDVAAASLASVLAVNSIATLIEARQGGSDPQALRASLSALSHSGNRTLIVRRETISDPLQLWAAHLVLDGRGVPPALRWPANEQNEQALYITWSADLFWLCRRNPKHSPLFRSWQGHFKHPPGTRAWHSAAHWNFVFVQPRYSLAHGRITIHVPRAVLEVLKGRAAGRGVGYQTLMVRALKSS